MKQHISKYIKRNAYLAFGIAGSIIALFIIVAVIYRPSWYDFAMSIFSTFLGAFTFFGVSSSYAFRFQHMIRRQENRYGITYNDTGAVDLDGTGLKSLSCDWFICSGSAAFYRSYVKSVRPMRVGMGWQAIIRTVDFGTYKLWFFSSTDIRKVQHWLRTGCTGIEKKKRGHVHE